MKRYETVLAVVEMEALDVVAELSRRNEPWIVESIMKSSLVLGDRNKQCHVYKG